MLWFHIPKTDTVPCTSNGPQHDIGNSLGLYVKHRQGIHNSRAVITDPYYEMVDNEDSR